MGARRTQRVPFAPPLSVYDLGAPVEAERDFLSGGAFIRKGGPPGSEREMGAVRRQFFTAGSRTRWRGSAPRRWLGLPGPPGRRRDQPTGLRDRRSLRNVFREKPGLADRPGYVKAAVFRRASPCREYSSRERNQRRIYSRHFTPRRADPGLPSARLRRG